MKTATLISIAVLAFSLIPVARAENKIQPCGAGSYSLTLPQEIKPPQTEIYKAATVSGPTPTNQWWSSLAWEPHSQNMFPHPMGVVCFEGGMSIGYPGAAIVAASGNIIGGGISKQGDVVIGHSQIDDFPDARLASFSDWFITAEFATSKGSLRTTIGHGSPFVFCRITNGQPKLSFFEKPQVWSDNGAVLGISVRGHHYGLFGAKGSKWNSTDTKEVVNADAKSYFSVALLPNNKPETLKLFAKYAHRHVVNSQVTFQINEGFVDSTYEFELEEMESGPADSPGTLFALYPHQWKYTDKSLTEMKYRSVRGTMKVATGSEFKTRVPVQGVLPALPAEGIPDRSRMVGYLKEEASRKPRRFGDTYYDGKYLGRLASLSGIADVLGEDELRQKFVEQIRTRLENWFTASKEENSPLFYYDKNWGTLIGCRPSFGSDSQLNDHHFHYGYFIRAAAEVARHDPEWAKKWSPMVELLIGDFALQESSKLFPRLRCFDVYAGHSWASGHAKFGDGNNQESSSESLNAWYGLILWGEATGNQQLRDLGLFLFNTERTAVEEYWFDVSETNFPDDYPHLGVGMVWGGKGAFATWFSGKIDMVHGINWLPFTPASMYMGRNPEYVKKVHTRMIETRKPGRDYEKDWGDLLIMFSALCDPTEAARYIDAKPKCKIEGGNSHAFMYHWIHTLNKLGQNNPKITADYPLFNVYTKDGVK
ncbi:MAG: glycosyl hydrolase, partial [Planctomycetota bacterium]